MKSFSSLYSLNKHCSGAGINHENQKFVGTIEISPAIQGRGLQIEFKAIGDDGTVYHEETSLLGPSFDGKPCLFVLSNNHPGVTPHTLKSEEKTHDKTSYVFGFGNIEDRSSFREEITMDVWNDGSVEYAYSWGLPGGEFKRRSGAKMLPQITM